MISTTLLELNERNVYRHPSDMIVVTVHELLESADIWCNVEYPAETEKLKQKYRDWLIDVFNLYGWDYNDSEFLMWSKGPSPYDGKQGIVDNLDF